MQALLGKRVLVTGGTRGIGYACVQQLLAAGAEVTLVGRNRANAETVAQRLGERCHGDGCDFSDEAATASALQRWADGQFDIAVNNAGVARSAPWSGSDAGLWEEMMRVNAAVPFRVAQAVLPAMIAKGWGRIVNVASNAGVTGYAYTTAYCAAKHAVVGWTRALALEVARVGVTVNAVCPGFVDTDLVSDAVTTIVAKTGRDAADARKTLAANNPQRRLLAPAEIAATVAFLCGPLAGGINGQALVIDGGQVQK